MSPEAALLALAESIADGSAADWESAEANATSEEKSVIRQLRVLSDLASLHRTLPTYSAGEALPDAVRRSQTAPAIGMWGQLALLERLGSGTFGEVYRAWDRELEREVALKLRRADAAVDDLQASRIAREGRLLARLQHPNVITVYGVGVHDRRVGLWMELVRGATLEELLQKQGTFGAREAALVGIDLCRALAAIHAAGLAHRDVKAQNVMREDGGRIVLMDLGTGREIGPGDARRSRDLAGTPLYLAPEIFDGAPASPQSDLYSLGVLMYHLVTGAFPVKATTIEELEAGHKKGTAVRLRDARADLPTPFVRVIDRAIAADPARRYETVGALEADLVHALDDPLATPAIDAPATRRPRWMAWPAWVAAGVLAIAALVMLGRTPFRGTTSSTLSPGSAGPSVVPAAIRSIAVLPLANLSGDPGQEYFSDGITDELISTLGRLNGINVISRTSVMQFKGSKAAIQQIAQSLHVDAVLEGSVMLVPGGSSGGPGDNAQAKRVRINARLIHAGTDLQVWNKTFEAVVADVFGLQREIATAVSEGIGVRLTSPQTPPRPAGRQDFDAFDLYLRGRYFWNVRTDEGLRRSIQYFTEALGRDPTLALAHAGIADAYNVLALYGFIPRGEGLEHARTAALQALELDDSLAEAHAALGFIHNERLQWADAESRYKRALELKPGYSTAHQYFANYLAAHGRFPEAIAEVECALALDPLSVGINGTRGTILLVARQYDQAIAQLEKTVTMDRTVPRMHMVLGEAYAHTGRYDRALTEINAAAALKGGAGPEVRADLGYVLARSGRRGQAEAIARELAARARRNEDGAAGSAAVVYAGLGDRDRTVEWLERAKAIADPVLPDLKTDPRFDAVRADRRFGILLAQLGFTQ